MAKLSSILQDRFKKKEKPKMSELAEMATEGQLTVFAGLFGKPTLGNKEKEQLEEILQKYASETTVDLSQDLTTLLAITSEVKAISNQAAILHGERIKRAQVVLKKYREGAFSAWLLATYGNRQTPYNFLQYYEFYHRVATTLRPQIELMPRQAVYTLASREGDLSQKEEIVRNYKGETKQEMITLIRATFPLPDEDRRREDLADGAIKQLARIAHLFGRGKPKLSSHQKKSLLELVENIKLSIEGKK